MTLPDQIRELQAFVDKGGSYLTATVYPPRILSIVTEINHRLLALEGDAEELKHRYIFAEQRRKLEAISHGNTSKKVRAESASLSRTVSAKGRRPRKKQAEEAGTKEGAGSRADDAAADQAEA